jgi:hypothetical protein
MFVVTGTEVFRASFVVGTWLRRLAVALLRFAVWLSFRLGFLAVALISGFLCLAFPPLRRFALQALFMAVGIQMAQKRLAFLGAGTDGGKGGSPREERGTRNAVVPVKIKPESAQRVATSAAKDDLYGVEVISGPGILTLLVGGSGMGKTELKLGMWRAQFDGEAFCTLKTTKGGRKLWLTEMQRPLVRKALRRWGFWVEPKNRLDRFRLHYFAKSYIDVEYASAVFVPDERGVVTDWPRVLRGLVEGEVWKRYDEVCVDTFAEWMGSIANESASAALGLCSQLTKYGVGVTVLHHSPLNDPTRQLGGSGVQRAIDVEWVLYGVGKDKRKRALHDRERYLECIKARNLEDVPPEALRITLDAGPPSRYRLLSGGFPDRLPAPDLAGLRPGGVQGDEEGMEGRSPASEAEARRVAGERVSRTQARLLEWLQIALRDGVPLRTTPAVARALALDTEAVRRAWAALIKRGLVEVEGEVPGNARGSPKTKVYRPTPKGVAWKQSTADRLIREALDGRGGGDSHS